MISRDLGIVLGEKTEIEICNSVKSKRKSKNYCAKLPAVTIKLYHFRLFFEQQFYLNNRHFVSSTIVNHFDFGCHSSEI